MKNKTLAWLLPLILLLLLLPFVVPGAVVSADAEGNDFYTPEDLPVFEPVLLENQHPEPLAMGDVAPFAPKAENFAPENGGYLDSTLYIQIEVRTLRNTKVFFTFVQIADPTQLRTAMAGPYPSTRSDKGPKVAKGKNTVVAVNGDWFSNKDNKGRGTIYRNGELIRTKAAGLYDSLIIDTAGDFHIIPHAEPEDFAPYEGRILHSFCFPSALIIDGELLTFDKKDKTTDQVFTHHNGGWKRAQRNVFCQLDTLTYLIITSEGPDQSKGGGLTIPEVAQLALDMGARQAFNLDGGSSAILMLNGQRLNCLRKGGKPPVNDRSVGDLIYFATAEP